MQGARRFSPLQTTAVLVFVVSTQTVAGEPDADSSPAVVPVMDAPSTEDVANPAGGGGSSVIERIETPVPHRHRLVYACREGSTPIFSDRPCGVGARTERLDLAVSTTAAAGSAPSTRAPAPAAATRPIAAPEPREASPPPDRCVRLEEALAAIDARMREGYSAREAARLWDRWRAAKAKLRDADC